MKKHKTIKGFDAVEFQRKVREKLSLENLKHPEAFEKRLQKIRKKYGMVKKKSYGSATIKDSLVAEPKSKYKKKK